MGRAFLFILPFFILSIQSTTAQDLITEEHKEHKGFRIASFIGHTLIPDNQGENQFFIPSWGFDVEYWLNDHWGLGWHNDIELQTFVIESPDEELIERDFPIISTLDVLFKFDRYFVLLAGAGYEFEKETDFFIIRLGVEAEFPIAHGWDVFPTVFYDSATGGRNYSTVTIGLGIGKHF